MERRADSRAELTLPCAAAPRRGIAAACARCHDALNASFELTSRLAPAVLSSTEDKRYMEV